MEDWCWGGEGDGVEITKRMGEFKMVDECCVLEK